MTPAIEKAARLLFGPLNPVWDHRWNELHDNGLTYVKWVSEPVEGKNFYRSQARTALETTLEPSDEEVEKAAIAMWQQFRSPEYDEVFSSVSDERLTWQDESEIAKEVARDTVRAALRTAALARLGRKE